MIHWSSSLTPTMRLQCEKCGAAFPSDAPGREVPCPQCGAKVAVRGSVDFGGRDAFTPEPPLPKLDDPSSSMSQTIGRTPVAVRAVPRAKTPVPAPLKRDEDLPAPKRPIAPAPPIAPPPPPTAAGEPASTRPVPSPKKAPLVTPPPPSENAAATTLPLGPRPPAETDPAAELALKQVRRTPLPAGLAEVVDLPAPKTRAPAQAAPSSAPAPRRPTLDLSTKANADDVVDLPAPKARAPLVPPAPTSPSDTLDLAPKGKAPAPSSEEVDLPAPKAKAPVAETLDLAPKKKAPLVTPPPPAAAPAPSDTLDLAPKKKAPLVTPPSDTLDLAPKKAPSMTADLRPQAVELVDLPMPRAELPTPKPETAGLMTPKRPTGPSPTDTVRDLVDLPTPQRPGLPTPKRPLDEEAAIPLDLGGPSPAATVEEAPGSIPLADPPSAPSLEPSLEVERAPEPAPGSEAIEVAPEPPRLTPPAVMAAPPVAPKQEAPAAPAPAPARKVQPRRIALVAGGALVACVAAGAAVMLFTDGGGGGADHAAAVAQARKLFADDTAPAYRRAAAKMHDLAITDEKARDATAIEAEAHLAVALMGVAAEAKSAEPLVAALDAAGDKSVDAEVARALHLVAAGRPADGAKQLRELVLKSPRDAMAQTALGWAHLAAGNSVDAVFPFRQALAVEPGRAAAHYGLARASEQNGEVALALAEYQAAAKASPQHLGAIVGEARLSSDAPAATERRVQEALNKLAPNAAPRELAEAWTLLGVRAQQAGRLADAEDRLRKALVQEPASTAAKLALARVLCDEERAGEAQPFVENVLAKQPKSLEALYLAVEVHVAARHPEKAQPFLARADKLAPDDARTAYWSGRVAEAGGDVERAIASYRAAVAADPRYLDAYFALSTAQRAAHPDDARATLAAAEAQTASDPLLKLRLGEVYLALGDAARAEACFRDASAKDPKLTRARLDRVRALEKLARLDDADAELRAIEAADPKQAGLAEQRAGIAVARGRLDEAAKLYAQALAEPNPRASLVAAAGDVQLRLGHAAEARALFERAVAADPRGADGQLGLARVELADGHAMEALQAARRALQIADTPLAHLVAGHAQVALGRVAEARGEYLAAARGPTEFEARLGTARLLVGVGAVQDALAELGKAMALDKARAEPHLLAGDCLDELGKHDQARKAYEEAVKLDAKSGEAAFKLGRSYKDAGKRAPGAQLLEKALALGGDKAPYAAEAALLAGDARRESNDRAAAVADYKKYLAIAPASAKERGDVADALRTLEGP